MRCDLCDKVNNEDARNCTACGYGLGDDPRPRRISNWLWGALLLALAAPFIFAVTAPFAIVLAITGLVEIRRHEGRLAGRWVGVASILISAVAASLSAPVLLSSIAHYDRVECRQNIFALGNALRMYCADNDDRYPPCNAWSDALAPRVDDARHFRCPSRRRLRCGYGMNSALDALPTDAVRTPGQTAVLFDAAGGWNACCGVEGVAWRHNGRANFVWADGHIKGSGVAHNWPNWDPSWERDGPDLPSPTREPVEQVKPEPPAHRGPHSE